MSAQLDGGSLVCRGSVDIEPDHAGAFLSRRRRPSTRILTPAALERHDPETNVVIELERWSAGSLGTGVQHAHPSKNSTRPELELQADLPKAS
jgi:hypothetical protein